ncbi:MAG: hypothetical protein K6T17_07915 [Fimbriimonadales bacterium]|nr:hypothetical protein [Fimbriimonadales bacterium]
MMKVRNVLACLLAMGGTWLVLQAVRPQEPPPISPCGSLTGPPPNPCGPIGNCIEYYYCRYGRVIEDLVRGHCCKLDDLERCWQYDYHVVCCKQEDQYNWRARCIKSGPWLAICDSQTRKCE